MLDSIYTAVSALTSFSNGLRTVSNNVSNMNTIGYRGFEAQFTNLTGREAGLGGFDGRAIGGGVLSLPDVLNLRPGSYQTTGNATDVSVAGPGFFVLRSAGGELRLTRNGSFHLSGGQLLAQDGSNVQAFADGHPMDFDLGSLQTSPGKRSTKISFASGGVLALDKGAYTAPLVQVSDAAGGTHALALRFVQVGATGGGPAPSAWTVTVKEGERELMGSPFQIDFLSGVVTPATSTRTVTLTAPGLEPMDLQISFSGIFSNNTNQQSSLSLTADGNPNGVLVSSLIDFDESGIAQLTYSNGQTQSGPQLCLGVVSGSEDIEPLTHAQFRTVPGRTFSMGKAGDNFGSITSKQLEGSNVELSDEFSKMIIQQRGYQAASEIITTANQMIDYLMRMRGA